MSFFGKITDVAIVGKLVLWAFRRYIWFQQQHQDL